MPQDLLPVHVVLAVNYSTLEGGCPRWPCYLLTLYGGTWGSSHISPGPPTVRGKWREHAVVTTVLPQTEKNRTNKRSAHRTKLPFVCLCFVDNKMAAVQGGKEGAFLGFVFFFFWTKIPYYSKKTPSDDIELYAFTALCARVRGSQLRMPAGTY